MPLPTVLKSVSGGKESVESTKRSEVNLFLPDSEGERELVREQLDRILAHSLFAQSRRYPGLLRFVVERTLRGDADQLKERLIGIEVFGRAPDYDANADPVVRVTAGEIRKRLAQYYYAPEHSGELRIELPTGGYQPQFVWSDTPEQKDALAEAPKTKHGGESELQAENGTRPASPVVLFSHGHGAQKGHRYSGTTGHLVATVLMVVAALAAGIFWGYWFHAPRPQAPVDHTVEDFWQPVTSGDSTVTICLGEPARDTSDDDDWSKPIPHTVASEPLYVHLHLSGLFALADVITLTRIEVPLQSAHKPFRVTAASEASFGELREGPVVLIGAFDNLWAMRMTRNLRFGFDSANGTALIVDRKSKNRTTWATDWDQPYEKLARDYAIIGRFRDQITGQPVILVSGISEEGTEAAGELISNAADLKQLLRNAPPNWRSMNMEAVVETQVIEGHAGPPSVRAVEFWP